MAIRKVSPYSFKVSCVIPVWKEYNVHRVLARFDRPYVDEIILVVDELTNEIKRAIEIGMSKAFPQVTVFYNGRRMGVGYAIRMGLKYSLENGYDVVVVMAGNGKDDPHEIPRLLKLIEDGYDYVQGSRFLPGGRHEKTPILRGLFIRLWPWVWRLFTGAKCTDVTNGFRAYRLSILKDKRINIDQEWLNHYALEYYIYYKAIILGYKYAEAPVTKKYFFRHRGGYSKIVPYRDWIHIVMPLILLRFRARR